MMGHKICFYGNMDNYPKFIPVTPSYQELIPQWKCSDTSPSECDCSTEESQNMF